MATQFIITQREVEENPKVKIIDLAGEIDESNLARLQEKLEPIIEDTNTSLVILKLKELNYINSKVIGYLAGYFTKLSQAGKKMVFAEASSSIMDILSLVGLTNIIEYYETEDEAKNAALL